MAKNAAKSAAKNAVKQFEFLSHFKCAADKCEDHCCGGWRVSINDATKKLYAQKAPELLEFVVDDDGGSKIENSFKTGNCSQLLDSGLCNVHKNYGEKFLPDTCTFYPKTVRKIGETTLVSATTSCPEVARLIVTMDDPFNIIDSSMERLPENISDFKMDSESEKDVMKVIERFIEETRREDLTAADVMSRIVAVSKMLDEYKVESWSKVVDGLFNLADHNYFKPSDEKRVSRFDIIKYLAELRANKPPRWLSMFDDIEESFRVRLIKKDTIETEIYFDQRLLDAMAENSATREKIDLVLKKFIAAELARSIFPYAGKNGASCYEKSMPIAIFFAVLRAALVSYIDEDGNPPSDDRITTVMQTLSRGTNHLSRDVVEFYKEKGFLEEGKLHQIIYMY